MAGPDRGVDRAGVQLVAVHLSGGPGLAGGIQEGPHRHPAFRRPPGRGPRAAWRQEDLRAALRTGQQPDGSTINPFMPWRMTQLMMDEEIRVVWVYLRGLK